MRTGVPLAVSAALAFAAGATAYARYRGELRRINGIVEAGGKIAETTAGPIEYAEAGRGDPVLLIHGAGGGYDQGLLIGRDFGDGCRIIAPSRFGYLRTPLPEDASPAAQADAHAALLDHLGIESCVVVGVSAGAPSAIELALRHPARAKALVLLVPRTYDPTGSIGVDDHLLSQVILRVVERSADFLFWAAIKTARRAVVRFLGVPPDLEARASPEERARVSAIMRSILPLSRRVRGLAADGKAQVGPWPLEHIAVPTLVVSAQDDLFGTLPGARFTAEHVPDAQLKILGTGGHLMVGQSEQVQRWVRDRLGLSLKAKAGECIPA